MLQAFALAVAGEPARARLRVLDGGRD